MPVNTSLGYVVTRGSIGAFHDEGSVFAPDAFPEERITHWLSKGVIRAATQEDVDKFNGIPTGVEALGSTASRAPMPLEQAEMNAGARRAEIEALELRIQKLKELDEELTEKELAQATAQQEAMETLGLNVSSGHSGAASTATNQPNSGATTGGGAPSEPVDPAKQQASAAASARTEPPKK